MVKPGGQREHTALNECEYVPTRHGAHDFEETKEPGGHMQAFGPMLLGGESVPSGQRTQAPSQKYCPPSHPTQPVLLV